MKSRKDNKEIVVDKSTARKGVMDFQSFLASTDGAFFGDSEVCPLNHYFADGTYTREMFMPKGTTIVGKIHSDTHTCLLIKGAIDVVENGKPFRMKAPKIWVAPAGSKRAIRALEDSIIVNVHQNIENSTDLEEIEKKVISESFEDFDRTIKKKTSLTYKLKQLLIKKLTQ